MSSEDVRERAEKLLGSVLRDREENPERYRLQREWNVRAVEELDEALRLPETAMTTWREFGDCAERLLTGLEYKDILPELPHEVENTVLDDPAEDERLHRWRVPELGMSLEELRELLRRAVAGAAAVSEAYRRTQDRLREERDGTQELIDKAPDGASSA